MTGRLSAASQGIAVVGMAARFPGANDCEQFWQNLKNVTCSVGEVPADRWDWAQYYSRDSQAPNKSVSKWGGFMQGVDLFDPMFFGISPREAQMMDPQQRILLELTWACLEDAGYAQDSLRGCRTGVFVGVMNFDYRERLNESAGVIAGHMATGAYSALVANRISHYFDWHGPSMPIDTACSSSLVALHQAVQSLRSGECDQALVGGVSVLCSPTHYVSFSKTGMLSPDGLCRSFDESANGYVRAEGAGLLLLKPLTQAIQDRDQIYGVIRGTATNHGGRARTVTYPNPQAQAAVIAMAHERAGVAPDTVSYIEAHGTGTPKGDPIEIIGLKTAFAQLAERFDCSLPSGSCGIASLKANVGHLEPVAGVAGVIKVLLAMKHRMLPGLAHFQQLNHRISLSDSPFYIVDKTQAWSRRCDAEGRPLPLRAGVSSFGFGGVNAHAVIEEFVPAASELLSVPPEGASQALAGMLILSAKSADRLRDSARRLMDWLRQPRVSEVELSDVASTLQVGRQAMAHRLALKVESVDDLVCKLRAWLDEQEDIEGLYQGEVTVNDGTLDGLEMDDATELVSSLMAKGKFTKVLALWVHGFAVDWHSLYGTGRPRRISLPTYPFARERHWVDVDRPPVPVPQTQGVAGTTHLSADDGLLYFEERWVDERVVCGPGRPLRTLLCFASSASMREAIQRQWAASTHSTRVWFVAQAQDVVGPAATEQVVPDDPESYRQMLARLQGAGVKLDAVLYLWPLEDARWLTDCQPIVSLLKACGACGVTEAPIMLAAQGDDEAQRCHWESWIGFERSAGNAVAGTPVCAIYEVADALPDEAGLARWASRLDAELRAEVIHSSLHGAGGDPQRRQVCRILPVAVSDGPCAEVSGTASMPSAALAHGLRQRGTYLITGGLGGLGRLLASHLVRHYQAQVVLVGRTPVDASKQIELDALSAGSGQVLYVQADVADRSQMADCLALVRQRFGELHGVVHAAGVETWRGLQESSWADFSRVLQPKVAGTQVLDALLADVHLDFLCYFSSSSAVVGDFGACSYAVANRFQMAHARWRQSRRGRGRTLAINWPLWRDGGMRVGDEQSTQFYLQLTGQCLLESAQGLAAFERLCASAVSPCLVMTGDASKIRRWLKLDNPASPPAVVISDVSHSDGSSETWPRSNGLPLVQQIEQDLLQVSGELLQVSPERLALDRNLAEFGFDSINLAALATALSRRYGVDVVPALFFSYPTLERLAKYFAETHGQALQAPGALWRTSAPEVEAAAPSAPSAADQAADRVSDAVSADEAIAIIGMSGRFPNANDVDALWRLLAQGHSAIGSAPADRGEAWKQVQARGGFLSDIDQFDSLFFEISPREADGMDPRHRLVLEECWKALEDAGQTPEQLSHRSVGTFVGVEEGDYHRLVPPSGHEDVSITSEHTGILAGRLSYFLDLHGPTLAVNTACSSGLVALHQACQSLRTGECDTAIVASAHVMATPHGLGEMRDAGMLSPQGQCHVFDEAADGMVPGEAVVVLVLKRLSHAVRDNDRVHALIAATGINSDGRTNGITAPNGVAQAALIESVYRRYRIDPGQIDCVIAHGTGTKLGDPVEVNALSQAFRKLAPLSGAPSSADCALLSVKPYVGHTLAASGLVNVVALTAALHHQTIPGNLGWQRPNPFIQWADSPFVVNHQQRPWLRRLAPRWGAVSAFGMSGTNAHAVLGDFSVPTRSGGVPQAAYLWVLSAKTDKALKQRMVDMADFFEAMARGDDAAAQTSAALADISYTLMERRTHFSHRCAVVASSAAEVARMLRQGVLAPVEGCIQHKVVRGFRPDLVQQKTVESLLITAQSIQHDADRLRQVLGQLATFYVQGYVMRTPGLTPGCHPRLVCLPAYPFAPVRHWLTVPATRADGVAQSSMVVSAGTARTAGGHPLTPVNAHSSSPPPDAASERVAAAPLGQTVLLTPVWDVVAQAVEASTPVRRGRLLVVGDPTESLRAVLEAEPDVRLLGADLLHGRADDALLDALDLSEPASQVLWLVPAPASEMDDAVIDVQQHGVLAGFRLVQALLAKGYGERHLELTVVTQLAQAIGRGDEARASHAGVHGMVGSLAKERPLWKIRLVDLPSLDEVPLVEVLSLPADRRGHAWAYRHGEWYRRRLVAVQPQGHYHSPYRDRGVYIVIGGAGDIGEAWTEHVMRQHGARVVWVGRRALDAEIEARLARLADFGPPPLYVRADATQRHQLQSVRDTVRAQWGAVHGVVHAAMEFSTQDLAGMSEPQFMSALKAKVDVSVRVAQVFANDALDFLLFFSSLISLIKNARQAHYAAGCAFKDAFARQLGRQVAYPVKVVNWGYWAAQKNAEAPEVRLLTELGMGLIEPDQGMRALEILLGSSLDQLGVMSLVQNLDIEGVDASETITIYSDK